MSRKTTWWMASLMIVAAALTYLACSDGCPEGQRLYQGQCIPESSDGDRPDGDTDIPYIPGDGDRPQPDGDRPDGDNPDDAVRSGSGRCGDPYTYDTIPYNTLVIEDGVLADMGSNLSGAPCVDGDGEVTLPGMGPEVVLILSLRVGDRVHLTFGGNTFDALIYVLSQCSEAAQCLGEIVNNGADGHIEQTTFIPEFQGGYYVIFDSATPMSSGAWRYTLEIQTDGPIADGDSDGDLPTDGDGPTDGDIPDGDIPDGDQTDGDSDGDVTDGDISDGDDTVPQFDTTINATYPVTNDANVPGNFTDLFWRSGGNPQLLYAMNDLGLATLGWEGTGFNTPLFSATNDAYRGLVFVGGAPVYLNKSQRKIQGVSQGDIDFPPQFGSEPTGLAFLDGVYYVADGTNNRLYNFRYNSETSSWVFDSVGFPEFGTLAGVTAGASKLWVLNTTGTDSHIHRLNPATGATEAIYTREDVLFTGISYNADLGSMWATHGAVRAIVRLNRSFLETQR